MIQCKLCGKKLDLITPSHLAAHCYSMEEYREEFPSAPILSKKTKRILRCHQKKAVIAARSPEARRKNSEAQKAFGKTLEGKKQKKRRDRALKKFSRSLKGKQHQARMVEASKSPKAVARRTQKYKKWLKTPEGKLHHKGMTQASHTPAARAKHATTKRAFYQTLEGKKQQREMVEKSRTPKARKRNSEAKKKFFKTAKGKKHHRKMIEAAGKPKFTRPERIVISMLRELGYYGRGVDNQSRFRPHVWLPAKFNANGDLVNESKRLIIHVDGPSHYMESHPGYRGTDRDDRIDRWCVQQGWFFLRLTDLDILHKPAMCRNMIRRLIKGRVIPLIEAISPSDD